MVFDNSDKLLQAKQILVANGIKCSDGATYRTLLADYYDKKGLAKMLKKEKIKCGISEV